MTTAIKNQKDNTASIERLKVENELVNKAIEFFEDAGVTFPKSRHEHIHGLAIYIDPTITRPVLVSPFALALSPKGLMNLYLTLTRDEKGFTKKRGESRIQEFVMILNDLVKEGYGRGSVLSHNIETGKYRIKATDVLNIFAQIIDDALTYSMGGDKLNKFSDIYRHLGGENGTRQFFREVLEATEASIPELDENTRDIRKLPHIKCYTCKHCVTDEYGERMCKKIYTELGGDDYDRNPGRYYDVHQGRGSDALVSAIIDSRIDECEHYKMR